MTPQCIRSVVQVLAVKIDIKVLILGSYDIPVCEVSGSCPGCPSGYKCGDLESYDTLVFEVSGSGPVCQSGYRSVDL